MPIPTPLLNMLLQASLSEDLAYGDITTDPLVELIERKTGEKPKGKATVVTREACIVSGLTVAEKLCKLLDEQLAFKALVKPGQSLAPGDAIGSLEGPLQSLLHVERPLLNTLQHLFGVATTTKAFLTAIADTDCRLTHTRKTTPGLRPLEIQAVIDGGGSAHRPHAGAAAMVKDNHKAAAKAAGLSLSELLEAIQKRSPHTAKLVVEADTMEEAAEAVNAGADIILLDNFSVAHLSEAVRQWKSRVTLEASGKVTLKTVHGVAKTGVDVISTSQITMGAKPVDIGLDWG